MSSLEWVKAIDISRERHDMAIVERGDDGRSTTAERVKAIREWTEADRPPAPDLSLDMMLRETIYE
jgi:hypothetical protein